ncbi:MAG TPA: hypothetical protein VKT78_11535 [Fimbriimonadaceae bacterium]|nr:hypothetical protein [Fimbriimonadaceae bacterium]
MANSSRGRAPTGRYSPSQRSSGAVPEGVRIGLALVDPLAFDQELIEELRHAGVNATIFVRPSVLILDTERWRFVRAAGHELGVGSLLGATDDGRLPNWSCATIEGELKECLKLLVSLGQEEPSAVYLPGRHHRCAEGRYRQRLQQAFPICLGETERAASLRGAHGAFDVVSAPAVPRAGATVVRAHADSESFRRFLPLVRQFPVGPLSELLEQTPHT